MMHHDQDEPQTEAIQPELPHLDLPLGLRLRQAREQAGLSVTEAAERMRLKASIVDAMERENVGALGASVYVRGYYTSYARLLGLPLALVDAALACQTLPAAPTLHTTTHVSHGRYLFDRYARRAVYVVLTASIVVPVILLATRDGLPDRQALLTPLDAPIALPEATRVAGESTAAASDAVDTTIGPPVEAASAPAARDYPVMASLTPFYGQGTARTPDVAEPAVPAPPTDAHGALQLVFSGDSWVEVTARDGRRLAYGLIRAGESREFRSGEVERVSLGNSEAVEVRMNGEPMDISAFRRAAVARFTVFSDGSLAPAGG